MENQALSPEDWHEAVEGIKSYLRNAHTGEELDPSRYTNPYTRKPFEKEEELIDYWVDLLGKMPTPPPLDSNAEE